MGIIPSRNLEDQRREENGVTYFDRGRVTGKDGRQYDRFAIQTHFVEVGESQTALVEKYVRPLYREGDVLSFGAKVMAMCTKNVRTRDEVKPGFWANFLWRFAGINHTGVGMHEPYKLQLVIDMCGLPRVLLAVFCSAVTKPFGVHGVFYKVCGKGVGGIDGFYFRSSFDRYKELALINPDNPVGLCDALEKDTGIPVVLMDANDIEQNQLGKCHDFPLTDAQIQDAMQDNPSGQGDELTPLILIRPVQA
ncbi:MAG: F420-0--gamma-glutamyl ligase [Clostridiales bacterium]|nr:F420-0--gamma-glutamyl ligase [Clostridiales bacterium]